MLLFSVWMMLFTLVSFDVSAYVMEPRRQRDWSRKSLEVREKTQALRPRKDEDPTDYSWVKNLAAIGDSFTAGIGAGNHLGDVFHNRDSWLCSRYDLSYPMLVNSVIGPSVRNFQFPACSGDRSTQIFEQVSTLKEDMVIMTAGGNDLCLVCLLPLSLLYCIALPQ
jgi:hypothetical protein